MCNYQDEIKCLRICVMTVNIKCNQSKNELNIYAILDCCNRWTFGTKKLRSEGNLTTINIKTLNGEKSQETEAISGLEGGQCN